MADHLKIVDQDYVSDHEQEFAPLPFYPWDSRPPHLPLDHDEVASAIHLANGDLVRAAFLLKVPIVRINRSLRASPRLQRILDEALQVTLAKAASIPIQTLFDPEADTRRLEWASAHVLRSRLAQSHPLSPAPSQPTAHQASLSINPQTRTISFRWRTDADDQAIDQGFPAQDQGDAG